MLFFVLGSRRWSGRLPDALISPCRRNPQTFPGENLHGFSRFAIRFAFCIPLLSSFAAVAPSWSAIINVPADQPTIQSAVAAAANGDEILIAPGTYQGGVYVTGKSLTFASWYTLAGDTSYIAQTVLTGSLAGYCNGSPSCTGDAVIEFHHDANYSSVIGLTLTGTFKGVRTGAIVDVVHCRLVGLWDGVNYETDAGGSVTDCYIADNADDGVDLQDRVSMSIERNVIRDNDDDGIEIRMYPYTGALKNIYIRDNQFIHNDEDGVQLIDSPDSSARMIWIQRNVFTAQRKAAIGMMPNQLTLEDFSGAPSQERVHVFDNTFVNENYGICGGVNVVAVNNLFANITTAALRHVRGPSETSYSLFWNVPLIADSSNYDPAHAVMGDPQLDASWHPLYGSAAIDAGTPTYTFQGQQVLSLAAYYGAAPDLGAYEFNSNAPVAVSDAATCAEGGSVSAPTPGVLANDFDPQGDPMSVTRIVTPPIHGVVGLQFTGAFVYTHDGSETASDSFVYEVSDPGGNKAQGTVSITVTPTNDPPVAAEDFFVVDLNSSGNLLDVLRNDTDPDPGDVLSIQSLSLSQTHGSATIQGNKISYTPLAGWAGFDDVYYTIRDVSGATSFGLAVIRVADVTPGTLDVKVAASADDGEEQPNGAVSTTSGDLELTFDTASQVVGCRWLNLPIPQGSLIGTAWVQFTSRETQSEPTNLQIRGETADSAFTFLTTAFNISSRPRTTAVANWSPAPWTTVDAAGPDQRTTDLSSVIQEIVNRPGWKPGNALALIFTGTGHRTAWSQNNSAAKAPLLHVEWVANVPPVPVGVGDGPAVDLEFLEVSPNPSAGPLRLDFGLRGSSPATIELMDIAGRRVFSRSVGALGPGRHQVVIRDRLPLGVYLLRLIEGPRVRSAKVAVIR